MKWIKIKISRKNKNADVNSRTKVVFVLILWWNIRLALSSVLLKICTNSFSKSLVINKI
jgi:hypothetical protein